MDIHELFTIRYPKQKKQIIKYKKRNRVWEIEQVSYTESFYGESQKKGTSCNTARIRRMAQYTKQPINLSLNHVYEQHDTAERQNQ